MFIWDFIEQFWNVEMLTRLTNGPPELPYCKRDISCVKACLGYMFDLCVCAQCMSHMVRPSDGETDIKINKTINDLKLKNKAINKMQLERVQYFTHINDGISLNVIHI